MAYLIGTDEAGYGPNLGPLVVSATVWRVSEDRLREDLYDSLSQCVCRTIPRSGEEARLAIADSKALYQPGGGLAALECGVLAALQITGQGTKAWREIWQRLDPGCEETVARVAWHGDFDLPLPCAVEIAALDAATRILQAGLALAGVELLALRSRVVFPSEWNDLLDRHDNKATALSYCTLQLVCDVLAGIAPERTLIVCDKHGGRNRYGPLLQHFFPDEMVACHGEGRAASIYRWGQAERRVEAQFVAKGESFLPSALASMTSKYLRELGMAAFNRFWLNHCPGLKPTAGYPLDARRFQSEIAAAQQTLGIADRHVWRNR